jgi:hypothetical protein
MTLSKKDLEAIRAVFRDETDTLRGEISTRFEGVMEQLDGLYQRDEKREQENLVITKQISRVEKRVSDLEKKRA